MSRRIYRRLAALALAVGIVAVVAAPAGASGGPSFAPVPFSGNCKFQYSWADGSSNGWTASATYYAHAPTYPYEGSTCTSYFQFKFLCGVYGVPGTWYWAYDQPRFVNQLPNSHGWTSNGDICPVWGNDVVLNVAIVVSAYPIHICWNHNSAASGGPGWVYNGHSGDWAEPCYFQ